MHIHLAIQVQNKPLSWQIQHTQKCSHRKSLAVIMWMPALCALVALCA